MLGCNRIFDNKHITNLYFLERENNTKEAPALKNGNVNLLPMSWQKKKKKIDS